LGTEYEPGTQVVTNRTTRALREVAGLVRGPHRIFPLALKLTADGARIRAQRRHLYSYATTSRNTADVLPLLLRWITNAQRSDGGIAAYYSLLSGYSDSYPEVTGYIVPTLYDFSHLASDEDALSTAQRATRWLLSLQMPSGAFPGGLQGRDATPSVFNTGQILQGLVRAYAEAGRDEILESAIAAGDWLCQIQQPDGSWSGPGAYQGEAHTYYSMVAWALVQLASATSTTRYAASADRNTAWVLAHVRPSGWIDGINLRGYPPYLHFIAYVIQGVLECAILRGQRDSIHAISRSAWALLRRFETEKRLLGAYQSEFKEGMAFTCLTGNAQMSCVWLRLFEVTGDLRYLNAALKMNEMLKGLLRLSGRRGVAGGVAGSYPIWGSYQPLRYISWGCKFFADALMLETRLTRALESSELSECES
jgi:hypothetical protein